MNSSRGPKVVRYRAGRLAATLTYVLAFILPTLLIGLGAVGVKLGGLQMGDPAELAESLPDPPSHDPARLTAVIVAGEHGTEIIDFLPPYEILATTRSFNVYAVGPERRVLPFSNGLHLPSGLDFVPHYSFDEYDKTIGRDPDLIVIPALSGYDSVQDGAIPAWIKRRAGPDTILMTICGGTPVLADTGLMDGHRATSFHGFIADYRKRYPNVDWVRPTRYVDDGKIISSSSLTSGIDATLHAVDRLVGRGIAEAVVRELGYPHRDYLNDPSYDPPVGLDLGGLPRAAFGWKQTAVGVVLFDGVGELALGSLIDAYGVSLARVHTVAADRTAITSKHGLVLVPRWDLQTAPAVDRMVAPLGTGEVGVPARLERRVGELFGLTVERLAGVEKGQFAYDAALQWMARHEGGAVAAAAAANLVYPAGHLQLDGNNWTTDLLASPLTLGLLGPGLLWQLRRRRGNSTA